ncbi:protein of unknown function [Spirosoma endophyticum]|uniref:DUF4178 domain-containing protein n=2 Tax=Spirosoma endophyticum TaxID=662367 RepID=A0A1I2A7E4_9BACT|nr:protein of unknown function [Spirosoma endophyticum]
MIDMATFGQTSPSATLPCPKCQTTITYYDVSGSLYYVCPNCYTFFKYENGEPPEILTDFPNTNPSLVFPIGTEGYLNNQFVRVVGFIHKQEAGTSYNWTEHMLLQQDGRYVQLAEYQGHWMVIEPTERIYRQFSPGSNYIDADGKSYKLFNRYKADILNAAGEFDWNILDDKTLSVSEYINPPYMLISEEDDKRSDWYEAHYISQVDLAKAFAIDKQSLPASYGVGAIEPADPEDRWGAAFAFTGMMLVAVIVAQVILNIVKPSKQLLNESFRTEVDSAGAVKPVITSSFDVAGSAALNFDLSATLANAWIELPITLVNEQSGRVYEFTKTLEYYHGVESGESWSEGSSTDNAVLSRIPSGRYHLNIYPAIEGVRLIPFRVIVEQNTTLTSNLVGILVLLAIFPAYLFWSRQSFETRRWSNSDFADKEE